MLDGMVTLKKYCCRVKNFVKAQNKLLTTLALLWNVVIGKKYSIFIKIFSNIKTI